MTDLDIIYNMRLVDRFDLGKLFTYQSESISFIDIPVISIKELITMSPDNVRIVIKILLYFDDKELFISSQVCKLWNRIVFIIAMNKAFKYERHQVCYHCALSLMVEVKKCCYFLL